MIYQHEVLLSYDTVDQLNRHAKRLIDKEDFASAGGQSDGVYRFVKEVDETSAELLIDFGRPYQIFDGDPPVLLVSETRQAW